MPQAELLQQRPQLGVVQPGQLLRARQPPLQQLTSGERLLARRLCPALCMVEVRGGGGWGMGGRVMGRVKRGGLATAKSDRQPASGCSRDDDPCRLPQ